jgi:hypothetical protein
MVMVCFTKDMPFAPCGYAWNSAYGITVLKCEDFGEL